MRFILKRFFPEIYSYLKMKEAFGDAGARSILEMYGLEER